MADYRDRRAQAKFAAEYGPDSQPATRGAMNPGRFASKWPDPNTPFYAVNPLAVFSSKFDKHGRHHSHHRNHRHHRHHRHHRPEVTNSNGQEASRSPCLAGAARKDIYDFLFQNLNRQRIWGSPEVMADFNFVLLSLRVFPPFDKAVQDMPLCLLLANVRDPVQVLRCTPGQMTVFG